MFVNDTVHKQADAPSSLHYLCEPLTISPPYPAAVWFQIALGTQCLIFM